MQARDPLDAAVRRRLVWASIACGVSMLLFILDRVVGCGAEPKALVGPPAELAPLAAPAPAGGPVCRVGPKLVPTCGVLWGAAAGAFTDTPNDVAVKAWEKATGRTATLFHVYHRGDEVFPTAAELAMVRDKKAPRILFTNWKVAWNTTWAAVARGGQDARIDAAAERFKAFGDPFFLAIHHEPENDVSYLPGSGMTAKDYAAMYRHVIERLRARGVTNAVNVWAMMGLEKWYAQHWWEDLYPGNDVVDWIGIDAYLNALKGYNHGDFASMLDRKGYGRLSKGFYHWATTFHPRKPIMVSEWGVYHGTRQRGGDAKSAVLRTVLPELRERTAIKALVYFDTPKDHSGDRNISVVDDAATLRTFRAVAMDPIFNVRVR